MIQIEQKSAAKLFGTSAYYTDSYRAKANLYECDACVR